MSVEKYIKIEQRLSALFGNTWRVWLEVGSERVALGEQHWTRESAERAKERYVLTLATLALAAVLQEGAKP